MSTKTKFCFAFLASSAMFLAATPSASATTIDFSCSSSNNTVGVCVSGTAVKETVANTLFYTEHGYNVSLISGNYWFNPSRGNPSPSLTGGMADGAAATGEIEVTSASSVPFYLDSFDYANGSGTPATNPITYKAVGFSSTNTVLFTLGPFTDSAAGAFTYTLPVADQDIKVSYIEITQTGGSSGFFELDNIDVTPSPEPTSLILLGTGLLGLGGMVRRRLRA
jgi:hypothetical protein